MSLSSKVDGSAEDALKQIDEKGYLIPYKFEDRHNDGETSKGRKLVKVGVNISTQTCTLASWLVAE